MILFLFIFSFLFGLTAEIVTKLFGKFFGLSYSFHIPGPIFLQVPLLITLVWVLALPAFIFITNGLFAKKNKSHSIFYFSFVGAVLGVLLDLLLDPVSVKLGLWTYIPQGWYFGVPISNFIGVFIAIFSFGVYTRLLMKKKHNKVFHRLFRLSIIAYIGLLLFGVTISLANQMYALLGIESTLFAFFIYLYKKQ